MPRRRAPLVAVLLATFAGLATPAPAGAQGPHPALPEGTDPLAWMLDDLGLAEAQLGVHPRGYHARFPQPGEMPYLLPFFADLWAEPLRIYDWSAGMAAYAGRYLDPDTLAGTGAGPRPDAAYHLLFHLGVCRLTSRFRDDPIELRPHAFGDAPLVEAVRQLREARAAGPARAPPGRDGDVSRRAGEEARAARLDPALQEIVAAAVLDLADARSWIDLAFRNVPRDDRIAVWRVLDLGAIQRDGLRYDPAVDDVMAALDRESLLYGAMKATVATEALRARLRAWQGEAPREAQAIERYEQLTPLGRVVIAGTGADEHGCSDCLLLIDLGGDDTYAMPVGAPPDPDLPLSVALDMAGHDHYQPAPFGLPTQGAGVLGVGVLWDAAGHDIYRADGPLAQGAAQIGVGLLFDEGGNDHYQASTSAQGAAFFGIGMLADADGGDRYECHGECQGFGGSGGAGVLADGRGDDQYTAGRPSGDVGRSGDDAGLGPDPTSAQGAGRGRRGDGGDGHSWAGGLGLLLDLAGEDRYEAGTFSQGCGTWFGTGVLYEAGGDDVYESAAFSHGSGAHFCIGAAIDEAGNDERRAVGTGTCALGCGSDHADVLMLDREGDDLYVGRERVLGVADGCSTALAVDLAGDDRYELTGAGEAFGAAGALELVERLDPARPYLHDGTSLGLFLDGDGQDRYQRGDGPDPVAAEGFYRRAPAADDEAVERAHLGAGLDAPGGEVEAFRRLEER